MPCRLFRKIYLAEKGQVFEDKNAMRSTKSIVLVTIGTDAYVIVGGESSSLNIYQKGLLEDAMEKFKEPPTPFSDLYDWLVNKFFKITFNIDPNIQAHAQYKVTADGCCISFKNESNINCYSLSEELVHAVQHQRFYKSSMDTP